jgi:glyoxylase-like metal-dependent hydrolase (beta-lactamase superfamily II)
MNVNSDLGMKVQRMQLAGSSTSVDMLQLEGCKIYRIADIEGVAWPAQAMFADLGDEQFRVAARALPHGYISADDGAIYINFNSYLIETPDQTILIDTGIGNDKQRLDRPTWHLRKATFLSDLAALGFSPERIDMVVNTHLHADHVGWNTVLQGDHWVPTFPRARYIVPKAEFEHWSSLYDPNAKEALLHGSFFDSVLPLQDAGNLELVDTPSAIASGVFLEPAHGHSPGMAIVRLVLAEHEVVFLADAIHHPVQLVMPHLVTKFCADPHQSWRTRRDLTSECVRRRSIVAPYHFPGCGFGQLVRHPIGVQFIPLDSA